MKIEYVRQQGPDCVVSRDGVRTVIKDCDLETLFGIGSGLNILSER
jgi:hypothetical protein